MGRDSILLTVYLDEEKYMRTLILNWIRSALVTSTNSGLSPAKAKADAASGESTNLMVSSVSSPCTPPVSGRGEHRVVADIPP